MTDKPLISALVVIHNEERQIADCLAALSFADELVVVLDRCTDRSREIAAGFTDQLHDGAWELEADRRNFGIAHCAGSWVLEVDADERVSPGLATEIRAAIAVPDVDRYLIPVDNYIGAVRVRYGWGGGFGKSGYHGLFRKGCKVWGKGRIHPAIQLSGRQGPTLAAPLIHLVDRNISDMLARLDRYTTAKAHDLREFGDKDSTRTYIRRGFTRAYKCYVTRKGYREGTWGVLIAILAGLYPLLSHLKAKLEPDT